jgi:hypothetical protein
VGEGEKAVVRVGMSVRGLTLTHDRLGRNSIVIVGDRAVFGNTANSVGCNQETTTSRSWPGSELAPPISNNLLMCGRYRRLAKKAGC